jgi:hypothetical protein
MRLYALGLVIGLAFGLGIGGRIVQKRYQAVRRIEDEMRAGQVVKVTITSIPVRNRWGRIRGSYTVIRYGQDVWVVKRGLK